MASFKEGLDTHSTFCLVLLASALLFLLVPQIRNVSTQVPRLAAGPLVVAGFFLFLITLLVIYIASLFVVMRPYPFAKLRRDLSEYFHSRLDRAGRRSIMTKLLRPSRWVVRRINRFIDWICTLPVPFLFEAYGEDSSEGFAQPLYRPKSSPFVRALLLLAGGWLAVAAGWLTPLGHTYLLSSCALQTIGAFLAALGFCLAVTTFLWRRRNREGAVAPVSEVSVNAVRILSFAFAGWIFGEVLWLLGYTSVLDGLFSLRLVTIWAVLQTLWMAVALALFIDRWHSSATWAVRPVAIVAILLLFLGFGNPLTIRHDTYRSYLLRPADAGAEAPAAAPASRAGPNSPRESKTDPVVKWMEELETRLSAVEDGPAVLVAASGGGSRAAVFAALVLELLSRTPLDPDEEIGAVDDSGRLPRTWADNLVLMSSVSGGSLATAHFVNCMHRGDLRREAGTLLRSTKSELVEYCADKLEAFPDTITEKDWGRIEKQLGRTLSRDRLRELRTELAGAIEDLKRHRERLAANRQDGGDSASPAAADSTGEPGELPESAAELESLLAAFLYAYSIADADAYVRTLQARGFDERDLQSGAGWAESFRKFRWVFRSVAFDELCTDFMAPILRGVLSPASNRGDCLAEFWTEMFGWRGITNRDGFPSQTGATAENGAGRLLPIVLLNATRVDTGSRLVVGIPPVPSRLWTSELWKERDYGEDGNFAPPMALDDRFEGYRLSLAHAVRLSSNFPWGFRVLELDPPPTSEAKPLHILDGGVVDNTGIDTIYAVFRVLEHYATAKVRGQLKDDSEDSVLRARYEKAHQVLELIWTKGFVVIEIDSGAKPDEKSPHFLKAYFSEPIQALGNAGYTNAERARLYYKREIARIVRYYGLNYRKSPERKKISLKAKDAPEVHGWIVLRCNHYTPGAEKVSPGVMTAWALGPKDKADVVARFLLELGSWDDTRRLTLRSIEESLSFYETASDPSSRLRQPVPLREILDLRSQKSLEYIDIKQQLKR